MIFDAITREVLKHEPERFQHFRRGPADKNVSENLFDCYYCIKTFCHLKTLKKIFQKVILSCIYNGAKSHVACECFENSASNANDNIILTSRNYICYCAHY